MATRLPLLGAGLFAAALAPTGSAQDNDGPRPVAGRVLDAGGEPAAGVDVCLRWRAHPELPGLFGHSLTAAVGGTGAGRGELGRRTDAKGRFRFEPPHRGPFLLIAHTRDREHGSRRVFPVMHGSFHTLRLLPSFFMGGRVVGADGEPVPGARVRLAPTALQWERVGLYNEPMRRSETISDAKGRFRLLYEHGYLRSPRWTALTCPLAVEGERSSSVSLQPLRPVRSSRDLTLVLGRGPAMSGRVIDRRRKPVAGAGLFDPGLPGVARTTDADGRYRVPACSGRLWVRAEGLAPASLTGGHGSEKDVLLIPGHELEFAIAGPTGPLVARRVLWVLLQSTGASPEWTGTTDGKGRITVRGLPSGQLLLAFVEIDGRFRRFFTGMVDSDGEHEVRVREGEVVHGQALSATRQPLPGVRVVLWPRDPGAGKPAFVIPPRVTYTDHGGRFAFDPVAGEHAVAVDAGRHGAVSRVVAAAELGDEQVLQLPGTPGVKGRVLDAEGRPAPGAWVTISRTVGPAGEPDGAYAPAPRLGMQALCTLADENGEFAFTGLPAGVTWSAVGALMRDDVKYNATAAVPTGGTVELRLGLQQQ